MSAVTVGRRLMEIQRGVLSVDPGGSSNTNGAIEGQYLTHCFSVVRLYRSNPDDLAGSTAGSWLSPNVFWVAVKLTSMARNSGETPDEVENEEIERLEMGEPVFNEERDKLGEIRGFDNAGFYVTMREDYEAMSVEHTRSGKAFGRQPSCGAAWTVARWAASRMDCRRVPQLW